MADTKVSALTALTGANVEMDADVFPIIDNSVTTTKKILVSELVAAMGRQGTLSTTTGGTAISFTSIPAWAKEITISWVGLSSNGTSQWIVQIGDSGGYENSGYEANAGYRANETNGTDGFPITAPAPVAASVYSGSLTIILQDAATFMWVVAAGIGASVSGAPAFFQGYKALSAALDRIQITTSGGVNTFDVNGGVNIRYR